MAFDNFGPFNMTAGEALVADRFVLQSAGTAKFADAGEEPIGLTKNLVASGESISIKPLMGNVQKVTGSKAIAAGAAIYVTTDGKVSDAAVGKQIGLLMLNAITADGGKANAIVWGPRGGQDTLAAAGGTIKYFDDFFSYDDTAAVGDYAEVSDGTPAVDVGDENGGVLSIATGATDENETYISSLHEVFTFQTNKAGFFETLVKLTEADTNKANIIVGLSDTVGADFLQDAGAGPAASYVGAVFYKVDGGTDWNFESSNAGVQDTELAVAAFTDATFTKLGFKYDPNDGVTAIITPFVNGVAGTPVNLTIAGLAEMHLVMGAKAGSANAETLLVDYIHYEQDR